MTFSGTMATMTAEGMSLKARLSWKYLSVGEWAVIKTESGEFFCCDETMDLSTATIIPDEDALISWLEDVATEHLESDRIGFLVSILHHPRTNNGHSS